MFIDTTEKPAGEVADRAVESQEVRNLRRLIEYMDGLDDRRFTMRRINHSCGAPACAIGHAAVLFGGGLRGVEVALGLMIDLAWDDLFSYHPSIAIKTPQQWAARARAYLAAQGL